MIVDSMTVQEAIAEARADLPSVQNKLRNVITGQEKEHRRNRRAGDRITVASYTSRRMNNWMYAVTTTKKVTTHNVLVWYYSKVGLCALQLSSEGLHQMYTAHFFARYRERSGHGEATAEANLKAFFLRNHGFGSMEMGKLHHGFPATLAALEDGYALGTIHKEESYVRIRTFINHEQARAYQTENREGLDALREIQIRYPALLAQLKAHQRGEELKG